MAWMRLEVSYIDHPKLLALSDGAFRLWHEGKSYCEKHLTDGLIPRSAARGFRCFTAARLKELQSVVPGYQHPLWEAHDAGFKMHDYLDHNDCRDVAMKRITKSKLENERKRKNQQEYRERKQARSGNGDQRVTGNVAGNESGDRVVTLPDREASSPSATPSRTHVLDPQGEPNARSKRPIFAGQRLTVFEWQFDNCLRILGDYANDFGLDVWFDDLDKMAVTQGLVLPKRDGGAWLESQLVMEAQRRGIALHIVRVSTPQVGKLTERMGAMVAAAKREAS